MTNGRMDKKMEKTIHFNLRLLLILPSIPSLTQSPGGLNLRNEDGQSSPMVWLSLHSMLTDGSMVFEMEYPLVSFSSEFLQPWVPFVSYFFEVKANGHQCPELHRAIVDCKEDSEQECFVRFH